LINKTFFTSFHEFRIKDVPSEVLENYFMLEAEYAIEWYYFALIDDPLDRRNLDEFIRQYNREGQDIHRTFTNYKKGRYMDKLKEISRYERIDRVYRDNIFPIPRDKEYNYVNGWGEERTFGGKRTHEGIDIITDKGVPIYSVCSGVVERIGWNELGGWRIGIRGSDNIYYYYAHLDSYHDNIKKGTKIKRGQIIGFVGNTGYGPEGTSDMFVDHLHFGMYENNIAINPYPFLRAWEGREFSPLKSK